MKFLFADGMDQIDPNYDFIADRSSPARKPQWDDQYPHEFFPYAPYDGMLVSKGIVESTYSNSQKMRFLRDGARKFLRFNREEHLDKMLMGDCGAFSYVNLPEPPYSEAEIVDFYGDAGFTHGCSIDHIIFDFYSDNRAEDQISEDARNRYQITLRNAELFLKESKALKDFVPIGAVQGWSPKSMANAAKCLENMGYEYIAVGGLVPLSSPQIHEVLSAIKKEVSPTLKIHLLGFAKADQIHEFLNYGITSFDSTSPLIRAFKDSKSNYYSERDNGGLDYYSAIKVPQATENPSLMRAVKRGDLIQENLIEAEKAALNSLRQYDLGEIDITEAFGTVSRYAHQTMADKKKPLEKNEADIQKYLDRIYRTLRDQPWKKCHCKVCKTASIETIIFRASNRNKRRGFHNLWVYYHHLQKVLGTA